jgi:hypothetical protein
LRIDKNTSLFLRRFGDAKSQHPHQTKGIREKRAKPLGRFGWFFNTSSSVDEKKFAGTFETQTEHVGLLHETVLVGGCAALPRGIAPLA